MIRSLLGLATLALFTVAAVAPAAAEPRAEDRAPTSGRSYIGYGRLITNDLLGDGNDRWRSGSVSSSRVWGHGWDGRLPSRLGALLELRLQAQVIAPGDLTRFNPAGRPYAAALSIGVHSHADLRGAELSLGANLVVIGKQNGISGLQDGFHDLLGLPKTSARIMAMQVANSIRPTVVAELGHKFALGTAVTLRPFAEARAGDETLIRAGADLSFGMAGQGGLMVRESVTGQRYQVIQNHEPGYTLVLGGDFAKVKESVYLPDRAGYSMTEQRKRLRAGLHWQRGNATAFYGLTYLSEEFSTQPEGQLVGSIRVKLRF